MKNNKITLEDYEVKAAKQAKAVLMKKQKGVILATIKSVARSGMSRRISFALIKNNEVLVLDGVISKLTGFKDNGKYSHEGLTVGGCGMDMVFHTLECFLQAQGVKDAYHYAGNYKLI